MEYIEAMALLMLWLSPLVALASIPAITFRQYLKSKHKTKKQVRVGEELSASSVY
jgi:hypothetical protein